LHRLALRLLGQLLKTVIDLLWYQRTLLDPAFHPTRGSHSHKMVFTFEYLNPISIFHCARLAENRGHAVAKNRLWGRDVSNLLHPVASPATREKE